MVELVRIDQSNWRKAGRVVVVDEQLRFIAAHQPVALLILSKAYLNVDERNWEPFALVADGEVVGVVALTFAASVCEIFDLAIDRSAQGRGHGTAAVVAVIDHEIDGRGCHTLSLTVHPDNGVAQHVYANAGFTATGETRQDEPVWHYLRSPR